MRTVLCCLLAIVCGSTANAASLRPVASFGANPGALAAYEYIPDDLPPGAPLVVVMHGCTQVASAMQSAGWEPLADQYKFALLYPEQSTANNPVRCFNWAGEHGDPANLIRGQGENASIMAMIDAQIATHKVDPERVFVVGLSAGAAFAAVMMATWPDRIAAGAIMSGIPYRCATDVSGAFGCQNPGVTKTADQWGELVRAASNQHGGPWPRVMIWQGSTDTTVAPKNADELIKQWTNVHGIGADGGTSETTGNAVRTTFSASGTIVVDSYRITGMGHAISIGTDPLGECTATPAPFFADTGICSTLRTAQFFGLTGEDPEGNGNGSGSGSGDGDDDCACTGGCTVGGDPTWLAMLFVLGLLRRRRPTIRGVACRAQPTARTLAITVAVLAGLWLSARPAAAALTAVTGFGTNPGGLTMYEYTPAGLTAGRPVVVVMHGCTQTAANMEAAGWNALADQYKFTVVYPEQTTGNNPVRCFNWAGEYGDPANLVRGQGENQSIMQMIDKAVTAHAADASKVFVVGFSAGGAMAAVLAATWPEKIAGVAIMSGIPYRCATTVNDAYSCQSPGVTRTAAQWGDLVRGSRPGPYPKLQIWHGASDTTVVPANQTELIKQWTNAHGTDDTADATETISTATKTTYRAGSTVVIESYKVTGMGHANAVGADPAGACPATAAAYFTNKSICSTLRAAIFFGIAAGGGPMPPPPPGTDTTAPTVAIQSPAEGDEVTGQLTVVIAASDDVAIESVTLTVDGADVGEGFDAPYQFAWDATAAGAGNHTLVAVARDVSGNEATATATVTVPGGGGDGSGGGNGNSPGGTDELPGCSLDVGGGGAGLGMLVFAFAFVTRRRRPRD